LYMVYILTPNMSSFVLLILTMILTSVMACVPKKDLCLTRDGYSDCSGHGNCKWTYCKCKDGWHGKKCENPPVVDLAQDQQKEMEDEDIPIEALDDTYSQTVAVSAIGVGAAVIIALSATIVVLVLRGRSSKKMDDGKGTIVEDEEAQAQA